MILFECLLWGVGNSVSKIGMTYIPTFWCLWLRFTLSFILFLLIFGKRVVKSIPKGSPLPWLTISFFNGLAFILGNLALFYTSATIASFLMSLSVIFTPFVSMLLLGRKSGWRTYFCILIVVAGLYFLCGNDGAFTFGKGEILALGCSASLGISLTVTSKHIDSTDPIFLATAQSGVAAVMSIAGAFIFKVRLTSDCFTPKSVSAVIYLALACTVAAYALQNTAMRHINAVFASVVFCAEPVFTAAASYFMLGERLSAVGFAGAFLIIVGVVLESLLQMKEANEDTPPDADYY